MKNNIIDDLLLIILCISYAVISITLGVFTGKLYYSYNISSDIQYSIPIVIFLAYIIVKIKKNIKIYKNITIATILLLLFWASIIAIGDNWVINVLHEIGH